MRKSRSAPACGIWVRVAPPTHVLAVGNYARPLEEVATGFPDDPRSGSGENHASRRRAIDRPENRPRELAVRSRQSANRPREVNRLWHHHFGAGIVATPGDFGRMGQRPTHPELLDWLSSEFVSNGWSLKRMHRLMVTSDAYRQSSDEREDAAQLDPLNRLLWRFRPQRLEAESIRDSALLVSGLAESGRRRTQRVAARCRRECRLRRAVGRASRPRRSASPQPLHFGPANRHVSDAQRVRYAGHSRELFAANANHYRSASSDAAECRAIPRMGAGLRRACHASGRGRSIGASGRGLSPGLFPAAGRLGKRPHPHVPEPAARSDSANGRPKESLSLCRPNGAAVWIPSMRQRSSISVSLC